jgi:hypothetical protein
MKNLLVLLFCISIAPLLRAEDIFIEAESFNNKGGWVLDNQSMVQMGSSYLLAHGLGIPVVNASTDFSVNNSGKYRVWVRTRNWVKQWCDSEAPGRFQVLLNGKKLNTLFGTEDVNWHWQDGGVSVLKKGSVKLELQDLTGFEGRCDAIYITNDLTMSPPNERKTLMKFRKEKLHFPSEPKDCGCFDLVVVGGGIAGCCAAISAARLGCKVALIQNRPVLGGNNSSEVRVGLSGLIAQKPYPNLGRLIDEIGPVGYWNNWESRRDSLSIRSKQIQSILQKHPEKLIHNAGPYTNYEDEKKYSVVKNQENLSLYLNVQVCAVNKIGNRITSVLGKNIETGEEYLFKGSLFSDCTGDGEVGFLSGADFRMGRESKSQTNELRAPENSDQLVMGTSVQWYADSTKEVSPFPDCPWAISFSDQTCKPILHGDWNWETGLNKNQITDIESIRDYALLAVYGNWSFLKNHSRIKSRFANKKLAWIAYIGGKRESRRLLGDIILQEQDLLNGTSFDDASFTTTWGIDLHYPAPIEGMNVEPFLAYSDSKEIKPFAVPYRCLYSRNISNLFMAGRDISVTHIALGSVRVMRTTGMMGEVVGMAASICKKYHTTPREVYTDYLNELKLLMGKGVGKGGFTKTE